MIKKILKNPKYGFPTLIFFFIILPFVASNIYGNNIYDKIVKEENKIINKLAKKYNLKLVDNASLIPNKNLYFLDSMHFTPEGMQLLAKNISEKITY